MTGLSFYVLLCLALVGLTSGRSHHAAPSHSDSHAPHWTYHGVGTNPRYWSQMADKKCGGSAQSPIDLPKYKVGQRKHFQPFVFNKFSSTLSGKLVNNGHAAQFTLQDHGVTVNGGDLPAQYTVAQFHFHWGTDDDFGSEHTIKGEHAPLEMHIVTFKSSYGSLGNALSYHDGLAVLGVMFEVSDSSSEEYRDNHALAVLMEKFGKIRNKGASTSVTSAPLLELMPRDLHSFYRYQGSLTTPPCSEVVTWTIFKEKVTLSHRQIWQFRSLLSEYNNFRPVQPRYNRPVYVSY